MVALGGFTLLLGLIGLSIAGNDLALPAWACVVVGGVITAFYLYRTLNPGTPYFVLSPQGILHHIELHRDVNIPWTEIHGVDSIDVTSHFRGDPVLHPNVTVFLVTKRFYDRFIHTDNLLVQGPNWNAYYIPKGDMVQVAMHDSQLPATAEELRAAVETRWKAFGKRAA